MKIIQYVLSAALLVGVYRETGPWATVFAGLTFVALETSAHAFKKILRMLS